MPGKWWARLSRRGTAILCGASFGLGWAVAITVTNVGDTSRRLADEPSRVMGLGQAMGLDPDSTKTVPFSITNKTYAYALEVIVLGDRTCSL